MSPAPQEETALPPWEELQAMEQELHAMAPDIRGTIHPLAVTEGAVLQLGEGSRVLPGTVIEGYVRIGRNCKIGPNAYLRGCVSVGDNCVVGHAVELKNVKLGHGVFLSHLSYAGDSVLRDDINVGGGCILSNFRHDAGEIRMPWRGELCRTGRNKLGCCIGSHARLGAKCVVLPGRVLPEGTQTEPGSVIR